MYSIYKWQYYKNIFKGEISMVNAGIVHPLFCLIRENETLLPVTQEYICLPQKKKNLTISRPNPQPPFHGLQSKTKNKKKPPTNQTKKPPKLFVVPYNSNNL